MKPATELFKPRSKFCKPLTPLPYLFPYLSHLQAVVLLVQTTPFTENSVVNNIKHEANVSVRCKWENI